MNASRIKSVVRKIAIINVIFFFGIAVGFANFQQLAGMANMVQMLWKMQRKTGTGDWFYTRYTAKGVVRHDPERAFQGYTLYTVMSDKAVFLADMNGRVVQRWDVPINDTNKGVLNLFGLMQPHIDSAIMFPNGDVMVVYSQPAVGPYGSTVMRLDVNGNVLWRYQAAAHHVIKYVDGKIYTISGSLHEARPDHPLRKLAKRQYIDDHVTVIDDRDGKVLERHSIIDMMANTPGMNLNEILNFNVQGDPLHANDMEVLTEEQAKHIPNAKKGDVLVSLRHIDTIALADLNEHKIKWVLRGTFRQQHDIDVLDNGNLMLFDNEGDITKTGKSRVVEIDPRTGGIVWEYDGTEMDILYSENRGSQQRLPNGNTLINESNAGRLLEVTRDGDVVWEYLHPVRDEEKGRSITATFGLDVVRYDPSYVQFLKSEVKREATR